MIAYQQPIGEVLSEVASNPKTGLSAAEAAKRLEKYGRNELQAEKGSPA
ncbi:MAG TPA: cation-transporting P-type ATPase [Thermoanaerobaculia bacterium]